MADQDREIERSKIHDGQAERGAYKRISGGRGRFLVKTGQHGNRAPGQIELFTKTGKKGRADWKKRKIWLKREI